MGIHFTSFLWSKVPTLRLYLHCSDIALFHRKSSWGYGENHHVEANCKLFLLSSWWIVEPETLVWLCRYDEYWFIWWNLYSLKLLIWTVTNSGSFLFFPLIYIEFPFNRSCYSYCYCSTTDLRIPWIITKSLFFVENKKNKSETVLLVFWSEIFFTFFIFLMQNLGEDIYLLLVLGVVWDKLFFCRNFCQHLIYHDFTNFCMNFNYFADEDSRNYTH